MNTKCEAFTAIQQIKQAGWSPVGFVGGSLTVGVGASNVAVTCWRRLFIRYLYQNVVSVYHFLTGEINASIGAMKSVGSAFLLERNLLPKNPSLVFVDQQLNDAGSPDKEAVKKGIEGIIRQLRTHNNNPDIVILGAGCRPGTGEAKDGGIDGTIHRQVAEYYNVTYLDIQGYIIKTLQSRGQTWDAVAFYDKDNVHLNDYGNRLWFECMRDWFEEQLVKYDQLPCNAPIKELPRPLWSDELQHTTLINPARIKKNIELAGSWERGGDKVLLPWYIDDVLVGRPGDVLKFAFKGTAIGTLCHTYNNGLKLEALLDGKEVVGPYTHFNADFCSFDLLQHGMENKEHILELTVGKPLKRVNTLEDPTARIAYLGVGGCK